MTQSRTEIKILVFDLDESAISWCSENCKSFRSSNIVDITDVSLLHDTVVELIFEDNKDVLWFKLVWGQW